ncbi:metallophosphoesterase [Pseudacidovorax intermedius]|uniref:metallophosphoesterase n=1 Tax=Pseudacidovorax intermedius TaxID=433924 RepID=UPI0026E9B172|nr:metallophosphoesterase [Pseudacidovorax intermedius]
MTDSTPSSALCDCSEPTPLTAVILYPSLGTPLLLAPGQKKCSVFIATAAPLGVANTAAGSLSLDRKAIVTPMDGDSAHSAAATVARHLRLVPMEGPKPATDTTVGALTGDGRDCATARRTIRVWRVGSFTAGALIHNQKGEAFATVSPQAVAAYASAGFGSAHVYEVELTLDALAVQPETGTFKSFAWMVQPTADQKKDYPTLCQAATVHAQDLIVEAFLGAQTRDARHRHLAANGNGPRRGLEATLLEYDVEATAASARDLIQGNQRLAAWHPVIRLDSRKPLKLGHLSDVHINVRHCALAKSPAKVIEDAQFTQPPVGQRVCNSFNALKQLFDQFGASGRPDTALLLTGDLIDFNRNIDPARVGHTIADQWKRFNVMNQLNTPGLYPRGLDDLLAFSLVRHAYTRLKLPVFMTSGNHEAYGVPYGISPRINDWSGALGVLEDATDALEQGRWGRERQLNETETLAGMVAWAGKVAVNASKQLQIKDLAATYNDFDKASAWHSNKGNEGIAADHNMTIFEAALAYGPTYAQVLTSNNYSLDNYDWFYALFTPLEDAVIPVGAEPHQPSPAMQVLALLGWGQGENYKNLVSGLTGDYVGGVDRQGAGVLPRATQSFSEAQLALLAQAQQHKRRSPGASLAAASHFTLINYDEPVAYSAKPQDMRFVPPRGPGNPVASAGFNHVNTGTCEINQARYFDTAVRSKGASDGPASPHVPADACVDWHFSGHSHRSGVYEVAWRQVSAPASSRPTQPVRSIEVQSAHDPGIHGPQPAAPREHTRFVVSSCGGPIGKQNLDHELDSWTLRPPSGTLLDPAERLIRQIKTLRSNRSAGRPLNEKPRLCVALDYLAVMSADPKKNIVPPLRFESVQLPASGGRVPIKLSPTVAKLDCIASVRIWVFEGGEDHERQAVKNWHVLSPAFGHDANGAGMMLTRGDLKVLDQAVAAYANADSSNGHRARGRGVEQAFFEVVLKRPTTSKDDWSADMDCSDPWVFPLNIWAGNFDWGLRTWAFQRWYGERGEVPDWDFLSKHYPEKGYINKKVAIERNRYGK